MRLVDLSHDITDGMTTYPGLPGPRISTHITREESGARLGSGASFQIGRVDMVANTGTYIDSPWHFHEDGSRPRGLALEQTRSSSGHARSAHRAICGDRRNGAAPGAVEGHAVLFHSGWDSHWGTDAYGVDAPVPDCGSRARARRAQSRHSSVSTRSTSTTSMTAVARRTRCCSAPASRSSST